MFLLRFSASPAMFAGAPLFWLTALGTWESGFAAKLFQAGLFIFTGKMEPAGHETGTSGSAFADNVLLGNIVLMTVNCISVTLTAWHVLPIWVCLLSYGLSPLGLIFGVIACFKSRAQRRRLILILITLVALGINSVRAVLFALVLLYGGLH